MSLPSPAIDGMARVTGLKPKNGQTTSLMEEKEDISHRMRREMGRARRDRQRQPEARGGWKL
jgi:hypothetical protein